MLFPMYLRKDYNDWDRQVRIKGGLTPDKIRSYTSTTNRRDYNTEKDYELGMREKTEESINHIKQFFKKIW
jgi:hypothetical protein